MHQKPRKPFQPPQPEFAVNEPTMQEPLLPVTCRCGRTIFVERRDVMETHRCPGCAVRFTIENQLEPDGTPVAKPKYVEDAKAAPARPAPQYPAPPPKPSAPPPRPAPPPEPPPPESRRAPPPPARTTPTPEERLKMSEVLPPNGAIREFLAVLVDEEIQGTPLHDAAIKALVRLGAKSVPFLVANLMAGPFHSHLATLECLASINDASAVGGLAEYVRSLKGVGQDDLKEQAQQLAQELLKSGR